MNEKILMVIIIIQQNKWHKYITDIRKRKSLVCFFQTIFISTILHVYVHVFNMDQIIEEFENE